MPSIRQTIVWEVLTFFARLLLTILSYCHTIVIVMVQTITITPSWQIHLPVEFRKRLGLKEPGKMDMILENDKIILKPKKSKLLKMAGKYKTKKPSKKINLAKIRDQIDYAKL